MTKTRILFLVLFLLIPTLAYGQSSKSINATAEKTWSKFYSTFQAAVKQRNRKLLKTMMVSRFNENCTTEGPPATKDQGIREFDKPNGGWTQLEENLALGTRHWDGKKTQRVTPGADADMSAWNLFKFANGRWLWYGCACYEC